MKVSIFFKYFTIIFIAFLLFQYVNIRVDYKSILEYRLALLKDQRDTKKTERLSDLIQQNQFSEKELRDVFDQIYQTPGYDIHVLVKVTPEGNYEILRNVKQTDYNEPYIIVTQDYENEEDYYTNEEEYQKYSLKNYTEEKLNSFENNWHSYTKMFNYSENLISYSENESKEIVAFQFLEQPYCQQGMIPQRYNNLEWEQGEIVQYLSRNEFFSENQEEIIFENYDDPILKQLNKMIPNKREANAYKLKKDSYFRYEEDLIVYNISYIGTKNEDYIYNEMNDLKIYDGRFLNYDIVNLNTDDKSDYLIFDFYYIDTRDILNDIQNELIESKSMLYLGMTVLAFFVSYILSEMLTRPIKNMMEVTTKISNNDFSYKLPIKSSDEITVLSENINMMSDKLNQTIVNLNEEIKNVKYLEGVRKEFIANFTHEIKTPIAIINGYIELIGNIKDEKKREEYLEAINKETERITKLVTSMLELTQLEAGRKELNISEVSMEELLLEIIDSYLPLIKKKNIHLHLDIDDDVFEGDLNEIEKVIRNLLTNAIIHTIDNGFIHIEFKDKCFSIENEGNAIEEKDMKQIFETYVSKSRDGTGLGLAICKAILELHHFKYGVENTETGVKFYFEV